MNQEILIAISIMRSSKSILIRRRQKLILRLFKTRSMKEELECIDKHLDVIEIFIYKQETKVR